MTHANVAKAERESVGITDGRFAISAQLNSTDPITTCTGFVRLSVGIEDPTDLIEALRKALDKLP